MDIKIGIAGVTGRVGRLITQEAQSQTHQDTIKIASGLAADPSPAPLSFPIFTDKNLDDFIRPTDCIIDFSTPDLTLSLARALQSSKKNQYLVSGTTGLTSSQMEELEALSQYIPILHATNMSMGVNALLALVEQAANILDEDWDIEILETHHRHKKDAPSGTALSLGQAAANGRGQDLCNIAEYGDQRHGLSDRERSKGTIGFAVQRGGDIVGDHMVSFFAGGEAISLAHRATDRRLFARGALRATQWLSGRPPGLYSMKDVLNLS